MKDYIKANLPEHHATIEVALQKSREATLERAKADAAQRAADSAYREAWDAAQQAAFAHFAANNKPRGAVVPADLLARVVEASKTPALEWDSGARMFRKKAAEGAVGTVATIRRDGHMVLLVRMYEVCTVSTARGSEPGWTRAAELEVWAHSGTVAGSGGRKRVVSEDDCAALLALAKGEVGT